MAWVKLPVQGDPYRNVDPVELGDLTAHVQDCIINEMDHTVKRWGLDEWIDFDTGYGVDGIYWWYEKSMAVVVSGGRVFKVTTSTGSYTELTGHTSGELAIGTPVSFATDGTYLFMANGGKIVHTNAGITATQDMADTDAPTAVRSVAYLDTYILAQEVGTSNFYHSDVGSSLSWTAGAVFAANGTPDNCTIMRVGWREIVIGGPRSVEIWYSDGVTPFRRFQGGSIESGILAPDTLMQVGEHWMWFNDHREFVNLVGRTPKVVSFPFAAELQKMSVADNAYGYMTHVGGYPLYVVNFPAGGRTFVYHVQKGTWTEWGKWNATENTYSEFIGRTAAYLSLWNIHVVGDRSQGVVYKADPTYYTDNGLAINSYRRTGFVDHGTLDYKYCTEMRILLKRPANTTDDAAPLMTVRWRSGPSAAWSNERQVTLGESGAQDIVVRLHNLGRYRTRQYEFRCADPNPWILVKAEVHLEGHEVKT